jgi:hypothetical protein
MSSLIEEINNLRQLLQQGAITPGEFASIKFHMEEARRAHGETVSDESQVVAAEVETGVTEE